MTTVRRTFGQVEPEPQPVHPAEAPGEQAADEQKQPTPSYLVDNPSVYGEPPKPAEDDEDKGE